MGKPVVIGRVVCEQGETEQKETKLKLQTSFQQKYLRHVFHLIERI